MSMLSTLTTSGDQPNPHILDNETQYILRLGLLKNKIKYQLDPLHLHRQISSERAIQNSKNILSCGSAQLTPTILINICIISCHRQPLLYSLSVTTVSIQSFHRTKPYMEYLIIKKHQLPLLKPES